MPAADRRGVRLSVAEFVGWTRVADVAVPYPLNTGGVGYGAAPDRTEVARVLRRTGFGGSPALAAAAAVLAAPRVSVYAVRVTPDGQETKICAVAGHGIEAVLAVLDDGQVRLQQLAQTELAAAVTRAVPALRPLPFTPCRVAASGLAGLDAASDAGESPRVLRARMRQLGLSPELIAFRERGRPAPAPSGVLGAIDYSVDPTGRHTTRSTTWREFPDGCVLQAELGQVRGEATVLLTPGTPDALFHAAVDALADASRGTAG